MYKGKEEPLTVSNSNKPKGKSGSISMKKRTGSQRHKKKGSSKFSPFQIYILIFIIFTVLFFFFAYLIYKNLKQISEIDKALEAKNKELEVGDNTRIELLNQIDAVEKQIELKKKYVNEKRKIDEEKFEEYNKQKKIFENVEALQNRIMDEHSISILLDESINNLHKRINALQS